MESCCSGKARQEACCIGGGVNNGVAVLTNKAGEQARIKALLARLCILGSRDPEGVERAFEEARVKH